MNINGTARISGISARSREDAEAIRPASRALVVREPRAVARVVRRGLAGPLHRRGSAFLAQLSLQYDDVTARRRQRTERLHAALRGYGPEARHRRAPLARHAHDLRI